MDRRKFLTSATKAVTMAALPSYAFAMSEEEKQKDYERYRRNYKYEPFSQERSSNYRIENNILPQSAQKQEDFWSRPRRIFLHRQDTGEQSEIFYFHDGVLNQQQYWLASYLLRDVGQKKMVYMDPKLLDLVCAVQAWLVYYGINSPIVVTSGFRTLATNSNLEGAAKNSMHLYGKALDFRVPGLDVKSIATIAAQFRAGGIGLYPSRNFLHLDTGGVRVWIKK